jgi:hypothetical protein
VRTLDGIVTVVQEGRFQLETDGGDAHTFVLSRKAKLEPDQLPPLQHGQARVRVEFEDAPDLIAYIAHSIDVIQPADGRGA